MKLKWNLLFLITLSIAGCSLAEDITPPPALATAQAAPMQQDAAPSQPESVAESEAPTELTPPETAPSLFNGASIYMDSCEPCHGAQGMGDGSMSGNLDVVIPALGDLAFAREKKPLEWYGVVTEGRMQNFMPPFSSLSDGQRWDVVAYALSLSYPPATRQSGEDLYAAFCSACHGELGVGGENGPALDTRAGYAERSLAAMIEVIQNGVGEMPALGESLSEEEQVVLAAYVQSLATTEHGDMVGQPVDTVSALPAGTIRGSVVNGTSNAPLPDSLEVSVVALEDNLPVFEQSQPVDENGNFVFGGLEMVPGRIYGALVEYQGVVYYSVGGHLLDEVPSLELPLTIYETTTDESSLIVDRLHFIFDFSIEGLVEVSELWLISAEGDRTVVQADGLNAIPITLPEGFTNLRFDDSVAAELFTLTDQGFLIHEPIRPDVPLEVVVTFSLPYARSLSFNQPLGLPVEAVVLLAENDAPVISGVGVEDLGELDMGGMILRNYAMDSLEAGEQVALTLRGAHPLAQSNVSSSNLIIGLGVLGAVLVGTGVFLRNWRRRAETQGVGSNISDPGPSRGDLLIAIAALDDAYEAGELDQQSYEQRRAGLKAQILERKPDDD